MKNEDFTQHLSSEALHRRNAIEAAEYVNGVMSGEQATTDDIIITYSPGSRNSGFLNLGGRAVATAIHPEPQADREQ